MVHVEEGEQICHEGQAGGQFASFRMNGRGQKLRCED